jgi:hypothetical protein
MSEATKQPLVPENDQFLTLSEIRKCRRIYAPVGRKEPFADIVAREITGPNIDRINKKLGQECDPKYLAYIVEYNLGREGQRKGQIR